MTLELQVPEGIHFRGNSCECLGKWQSQDTVGGSSPSGSCQRLVLGAPRLVSGVSVGSISEIQEVGAAIKPPALPRSSPSTAACSWALVDPPGCWALEFDRLHALKPDLEF